MLGLDHGELRIRWHYVFLALLAWLYTLPFIYPMLGSYFSGDDLMNLYYHRYRHPPWNAFSESVMFWTTYRRPVGGLIYLALYAVFGLTDPLPYYATGLGLFTLNLFLLFYLLLRLTRNGYVSALGTGIASIHREIGDIWFNFGAVYELLAFGLMLG
ncbi:MAG TPA: hypothetical protein VMM83_01035, partial [Longimicrobiales bacterium]|nr:hypothetical protein [Longimicrobiales bacterium]